jgi:hypothetical protein
MRVSATVRINPTPVGLRQSAWPLTLGWSGSHQIVIHSSKYVEAAPTVGHEHGGWKYSHPPCSLNLDSN